MGRGAKTKREAVDRALREMVARDVVYRALRKLKGKLPWKGDVRIWRIQRHGAARLSTGLSLRE